MEVLGNSFKGVEDDFHESFLPSGGSLDLDPAARFGRGDPVLAVDHLLEAEHLLFVRPVPDLDGRELGRRGIAIPAGGEGGDEGKEKQGRDFLHKAPHGGNIPAEVSFGGGT